MNLDTIYIIGAGAIGKALAVFLKLAGKDVILLRGSLMDGADHLENIQVELNDHSILEATVPVKTLSAFDKLNGLIVLTNKSFGNETLAIEIHQKSGNSPIVFLQNGLGVEQPFIDRQFPQLYRCVLFATSQMTRESTLRFKPVSASRIGVVKGDEAVLEHIVRQIDTPVFHFEATKDIQPIIWKKAIVNCVFNSVCPLLETDNGVFYRDESALAIAERIIRECLVIARESGISLLEDDVMQNLLMISKASDGQLISTLQDILNKRPTEIDTLNFEIVRLAKKFSKEHLVVETNLLGELTKLKSYYSMRSQFKFSPAIID